MNAEHLTYRRCLFAGKWFGKAAVLVMLIFSVGFHWALLQTAAWGYMALRFSLSDSVGQALAKTFDGKHPCALCKIVKQG